MMNTRSEREKLAAALEPLGFGDWQYHPSVTSTNDLALEWARADAPDWALVVADTQTAGRGRGDRTWETKPGGLALSLVLRPSSQEAAHLARFTALAGLGLVYALGELGLRAQIKWPNDVLLMGKKVAGVLVEMEWLAQALTGLVIGLGVNVTKVSQPDPANLRYPATSVEGALGQPIDRWTLLTQVLRAMRELRSLLPTQSFIEEWNQHLAFRDEWVHFYTPSGEMVDVRLLGVNPQGGIIGEMLDGDLRDFIVGEIVMR
jgi:BirA family transcriptional regulator, biotin operon repressor / biotin---[acetyl-CoA-carboxylase] ligase